MKFKHCIALLALVSTSLFAQTWNPVSTTTGTITTTVNTSSACPIEIVKADLGHMADGQDGFVVGGPAPGGGVIVGGPYTTYKRSLNVTLKNNGTRTVVLVMLKDEAGNNFAYVWKHDLKPGKTADGKAQADDANGDSEKGMAVWVYGVQYETNGHVDQLLWTDPNSDHIQKNGVGASCYFKRRDSHP